MTVAIAIAAVPARAADAAQSPWDTLFGASEEWMGPTGAELTFERYRALIDSQVAGDADAERKWSILTKLIRGQKPENQLTLVQKFFNSLPYEADEAHYHQVDYWASAAQFLQTGGDCEDYAIAKYRALIDSGFPVDDLRVILVRDTITNEAHAVLAARIDDTIHILDNQRQNVLRDADFGHYRPLYSLNELDVWRHRAPATPAGIEGLAVATKSK